MTVSLVTAVVDDGFELLYEDAVVGNIRRERNRWCVYVNGTGTSGNPPRFYSLEAAQYRALSVFTELKYREENMSCTT